MRRIQASVVLAWVLCAVVVVHSLVIAVYRGNQLLSAGRPLNLLAETLISLVALMFCIPAALIISKHPRNTIGWLLMGPALVFTATEWMYFYLNRYVTAPLQPTLADYVMVYITGSSWLALIFPLLLIPLLFPTGQPPSPRWRWMVTLAIVMILFFLFWSIGAPEYGYEFNEVSWSIPNPIRYLNTGLDAYFMLPWTIALVGMTVGSLASVAVRYRQAGPVEREQLKWLLYACAIFALVYVPMAFFGWGEEMYNQTLFDLVNVAFSLGILGIPAAIAIAILRYHLFDIDVIIRQTLVYALLTGFLGLVYIGGIVLLQGAFRALLGQGEDLAVVISTLLIAALFNPLRGRIQTTIDRRFFRQKYNTEQALAEFAVAARNLSNLDELNTMLVDITQRTLQPTEVNLILLKK